LRLSETSKIYEILRDSEGVFWYMVCYKAGLEKEGYVFGKIFNSDNTLEFFYTIDDSIIEE